MPSTFSNVKNIFGFLEIFADSTYEIHLACDGAASGSETGRGEASNKHIFLFPRSIRKTQW